MSSPGFTTFDPIQATQNQYQQPITIPNAHRIPGIHDLQPAGTGWQYVGTTPPTLYVSSGAGVWTSPGTGSFSTLTVTGQSTLAATTIVGTTLINASGSATTTIGTGGTGAVRIGNATGNTEVTGNLTATNGNVVLGTAGNKISIATGSNATVGISGSMVAGAVTVSNTSVTDNSKIFAYPAALGTVTAPQSYYISAIVPATSFTIASADATDTSTWNYWFLN